MQVNILLKKDFKLPIYKRFWESKEEWSWFLCGAEVI